jgi:hypothetical protein
VSSDIYAQLYLWNQNADEMIRLLQNIRACGVWSRQETARHQARLESLQTKLSADFRELIALRAQIDLLGSSERNHRS